jgi:hypothetical protein
VADGVKVGAGVRLGLGVALSMGVTLAVGVTVTYTKARVTKLQERLKHNSKKPAKTWAIKDFDFWLPFIFISPPTQPETAL